MTIYTYYCDQCGKKIIDESLIAGFLDDPPSIDFCGRECAEKFGESLGKSEQQ